MTDVERFNLLIKKLTNWRTQDHFDNIILNRHEICQLLDWVEKKKAAK